MYLMNPSCEESGDEQFLTQLNLSSCKWDSISLLKHQKRVSTFKIKAWGMVSKIDKGSFN